MRRRLFPFAGLVVVPLAACSLFTDLSSLTAGASPSEGGSGSEVGAPSDASDASDTSARDEAGEAGDAATPFCSGAHAFCADFDEGALAAGWSTQQVDGKATADLSTTHFLSPTSSFHATIARRVAGDLENATLQKDLLGAWKRTVIDVDVLVDAPNWQSGDINASLLSVSFANATGGTFVLYFPIASTFEQITGPGLNLQLPPVTTGSFFHVHLDIDPTSGAVSSIIDGKSHGGAMTPFDGMPATTILRLGIIGYNAPVPAFSIYYDNLVVDLQ